MRGIWIIMEIMVMKGRYGKTLGWGASSLIC